MHDAGVVRRRQAARNLHRYSIVLRSPRLAPRSDWPSQFADDVSLADVVHGNDIRMIQRRHRTRSFATSAGRIFSATSRPKRASRARYTCPMPPAPNGTTISYGPSLSPEGIGILGSHYSFVPSRAILPEYSAANAHGQIWLDADMEGNLPESIGSLTGLTRAKMRSPARMLRSAYGVSGEFHPRLCASSVAPVPAGHANLTSFFMA
jgi:hypothetical protein